MNLHHFTDALTSQGAHALLRNKVHFPTGKGRQKVPLMEGTYVEAWLKKKKKADCALEHKLRTADKKKKTLQRLYYFLHSLVTFTTKSTIDSLELVIEIKQKCL